MLNAVIPGLVDPAGRGGGIVDRRQGTDPLAGVARVSALGLGKFCISELNSRALVQAFNII